MSTFTNFMTLLFIALFPAQASANDAPKSDFIEISEISLRRDFSKTNTQPDLDQITRNFGCKLYDKYCHSYFKLRGKPTVDLETNDQEITINLSGSPISLSIPEAEAQLKCLALTVYGEARGEGLEGMLAVLNVIRNRVADPRYPNTPCAVVTQRSQFEAVSRLKSLKWRFNQIKNGKNPRWPLYTNKIEQKAFDQAQLVTWLATMETSHNLDDPTNGALFHWSPYSQAGLGRKAPKWSKVFTRTASIGRHVFYTDI